MKKKILFSLLYVAFLVACSNGQTFEDYFHTVMEENKKEYDEEVNYSYSLVHQEQNVVHENDAIAIFTENNLQGEQIFIAYFEKENGNWNWKQTRGAEWDTPVQWSSMDEVPYIYSGKEPAKIIEVEDNKRFWYAISNTNDVAVKAVKKDGTQKVIEEVDEELLKDWDK
ncbi:MAG: hypothetical protein ACQEWF_11080 [Bacillota bacterium]